MTPEREARLLKVLQQRQPDMSLITERVHKPRNIAALVRSCDAVGIAKMHFVAPKEGYGGLNGTSMGSDQWVETCSYQTVDEAITSVKREGMMVYAAHLSEQAIDFRDVDYTQPFALMLGAEKEGISPKAAALADQHIAISMMGMVESFNVSTAAGIILVEAQRQRLLAGMYQREGLGPTQRARILFEARNPKLSRYYRLAEQPYPRYDLQGFLVDPQETHTVVAKGRALSIQAKKISRQERRLLKSQRWGVISE